MAAFGKKPDIRRTEDPSFPPTRRPMSWTCSHPWEPGCTSDTQRIYRDRHLLPYLRMNGYNVLPSDGVDSLGLPAENYPIKTGTHPRRRPRGTSTISAAIKRLVVLLILETGKYPPIPRKYYRTMDFLHYRKGSHTKPRPRSTGVPIALPYFRTRRSRRASASDAAPWSPARISGSGS